MDHMTNAAPTRLSSFLNSTGELSSALEAAFASGLRHLLIPPGKYIVSKPLRIPSQAHLYSSPDTHIILGDGVADSPDDYLLSTTNSLQENSNIVIEGGIWNGNNRKNPRPEGLFDAGYTGAMFHFENVNGLVLKNLTLSNAEAYYIRCTRVANFHFENISFDSENIRPNNDGIHLGGLCRGGVIRKLRGLRPGVTGDDMVALNADDALERTEVRGMTCGPIEDILIEDVRAEDCHSFVRLLSVLNPIRNVRIHDIFGSCSVSAINADAARGCRVPLFDEVNPPFPDGVGWLENIDIDGVEVSKSASNGIPLLRLETRMKNLRIRNFQRLMEKDLDPRTPLIGVHHITPEEIHFL